jgi:transposase
MIEKQNEKPRRMEIHATKALTHKQLALMYGVSWSTFQNWIKKVEDIIGKKTGHFYHRDQVKKIFQLFGMPEQLMISTDDDVESITTSI